MEVFPEVDIATSSLDLDSSGTQPILGTQPAIKYLSLVDPILDPVRSPSINPEWELQMSLNAWKAILTDPWIPVLIMDKLENSASICQLFKQ